MAEITIFGFKCISNYFIWNNKRKGKLHKEINCLLRDIEKIAN